MFALNRHSPKAIVQRYVRCLNARDLGGLSSLIHPHCQLIDSFGGRIEGHDAIVAATERFFALEPHFHLTVDKLVEHEGDILLRGRTTATRPEFQAEAMWRACVEDRLVACWQSFGPSPSARLADVLGGRD